MNNRFLDSFGVYNLREGVLLRITPNLFLPLRTLFKEPLPVRLYHLHAPKYAGGLDRRGNTPTTINRLVDMLREEASPAKVLELTAVARLVDLDKLSKTG